MPPNTQGVWLGVVQAPGDSRDIGDNLGTYALHAVLLRTGRILLWSGLTEGAGFVYRSWSWDPGEPVANALGRWFIPDFDAGGTRAAPPGPEPSWNDDHQIDLFCSHHVVLEDGRVLAIGGAGEVSEGSASGNSALHVYDPIAERWSKLPQSMSTPRWYPTGVVIADARVVVFSGRSPTGIAQSVEIIGTPNLQPAIVSGGDRSLYIFPGMHMVPGGKVFYTGTSWQYDSGADPTVLAGDLRTASFRMTGPTSGTWDTYNDAGGQPLGPVVRYREEGTSCLLPPAQDGRILLVGGSWTGNRAGLTRAENCEILETQDGPPRWVAAGDMRRRRTNVHTVLLPDGNVLIVGGHGNEKRNHGAGLSNIATDDGHANTAEMLDPRVTYDPANVNAAFTDMATMGNSRLYHSTALLLPDGRVWTAGGEDNHATSNEQKTMELYEPPYMHQGTRPTITAIDGTGGPNDEIFYGGEFTIHTLEPASLFRSVVLMRPGSTSHHTDSDQRHVPLPFLVNTGNELRVHVNIDATVAPPGYYMVWALDTANLPCQRALFVRLSQRHIELITDRSTFSFEEVSTIPGGRVEDSMFVHCYGFAPAELGITTPTPTSAQVTAWAPPIALTESGTPVTTLSAPPTAMLLEDPARSLDLPQRITFRYAMSFPDLSVFPALGSDRVLDAGTAALGQTAFGHLRLTRQGNPYMTDGSVHWLSTDVRVFRVRAGESMFGHTISTTAPDPHEYIQMLLTEWDNNQALASHPFASIAEGQAESALQWANVDTDGVRVFNFAVARVRFRAATVPAANARAFFRLFTTSAANLDFDINTTYRTHIAGGRAVPLLGVIDTEAVTIPFFAQAREADMTLQHDDANVKTLPATGDEARRYFGAWLDFNEPVDRFPRNPGTANGPFTGTLESIQSLIRGRHQCLVAEINIDSDPNRAGDNPANSDNLSQRNLAIIGSDNPGPVDAHAVHLTFDLKPTWHVPEKPRHPWELDRFRPKRTVADHGEHAHHEGHHDDHDDNEHHHHDDEDTEVVAANDDVETRNDVTAEHGVAEMSPAAIYRTRRVFVRPGTEVHEHEAQEDLRGPVPDELMILWGDLPRNSFATVYLPSVSADEILDHATRHGGFDRLERIDDHTIGLAIGDVTYLPVPSRVDGNTAGLLTITLPPTVRVREEFVVVVKQISKSEQRVVGTFELRIPVSTGEALLADEIHALGVVRHVRSRIPTNDRWAPIFARYEKGIAGRVAGFGGDPTAVKPSPNGHPTREPCAPEPPCPEATSRPCPPRRGGRLGVAIRNACKLLRERADKVLPCECGGDHTQAEHSGHTHGPGAPVHGRGDDAGHTHTHVPGEPAHDHGDHHH